jgi:hypothetical protein
VLGLFALDRRAARRSSVRLPGPPLRARPACGRGRGGPESSHRSPSIIGHAHRHRAASPAPRCCGLRVRILAPARRERDLVLKQLEDPGAVTAAVMREGVGSCVEPFHPSAGLRRFVPWEPVRVAVLDVDRRIGLNRFGRRDRCVMRLRTARSGMGSNERRSEPDSRYRATARWARLAQISHRSGDPARYFPCRSKNSIIVAAV